MKILVSLFPLGGGMDWGLTGGKCVQTILQLKFDVLFGVEVNTCISGTVPPSGTGLVVSLGSVWIWARTGRLGTPCTPIRPACVSPRTRAKPSYWGAPHSRCITPSSAAGAALQAGADNSAPACSGKRSYGAVGGPGGQGPVTA